MPGAARAPLDICTGHGCWPSRMNTSGSGNVIINGYSAFRVGDPWNSHCCCSIPNTHASVQAAGSSTVFVNGMPLARIGDAVACGGAVNTGSGDVIVG